MHKLLKPLPTDVVYISRKGSEYKVIEYINKSKVLIEFQDELKYKCWVSRQSALKGNVKNPFLKSVQGIGYMGIGKYKAKVDNKNTKAYSAWNDMFRRCYCPVQLKKNPTYTKCTVNEIWYNFQNFAEWFYSQPGHDLKWQLDKDLKVKGNTEYSPETCTLLPFEINVTLALHRGKKRDLPPGVHESKDSGRYSGNLLIGDAKKGKFNYHNTPEEAFAEYKYFKEIRVKWLADKYKSLLKSETYDLLYEWEINIDDKGLYYYPEQKEEV